MADRPAEQRHPAATGIQDLLPEAVLAGMPMAQAAVALDRAGGAVKPAVLIAVGQGPQEAVRMLASHAGHLGPALRGLQATKE